MSRLLAATATAAVMLLARPRSKPPAPPARTVPSSPAPAGLSVARIDVAFRGERALVTTDLTWPRRVAPESFTLFVAHGAPGSPRAFDAELLAVPSTAFSPPLGARGAAQETWDRASAPEEAALSLGPRSAAGQIVVVERDAEAALSSAQTALRLRAVYELTSRRDVLTRLGPSDGLLALGPITVSVDGAPAPHARAALCGVDRHAAVALPGQPTLPSPARVERRAGESLCVHADRQ